jgi:hypothetical protein
MPPNQLGQKLGWVVDVAICQVLDSGHRIDKAFLINGISKGNICDKGIESPLIVGWNL